MHAAVKAPEEKIVPRNGSPGPPQRVPPVETDVTCQAFATWLTEMRSKNSRTMQEMTSEISVIREGITSNNVELSDFKRHSTGVSQQMQTQLTDLREKLTNAFSEITSLVKTKTQSDQEMMQDINNLQQTVSGKNQELEALKRSYNQAYSQLQSSLIQIQNHLQVTNSEVQQARSSCERVQRETQGRFGEIETNLRAFEEELTTGNGENRNQMLQLQEDIARIHDAIINVTADFNDHKRLTNSVHNKLQTSVWGLEDNRKRSVPPHQTASYEPAVTVEGELRAGSPSVHSHSPSPQAPQPMRAAAVAGGVLRAGSVTLPMTAAPGTVVSARQLGSPVVSPIPSPAAYSGPGGHSVVVYR